MKTINLNRTIVDLDGNNVPEEKGGHMGKLVSSLLGNATRGPAVKYYEWAMEFRKNKSVQMTTEDEEDLKSFINQNEFVANFAKAQILKAISEEAQKPKEEPKQ